MEYFSYKFSIKPLPKARRVVRIVTFTILLCFVILIYGFAFGIETDIPFVARMVGSTVIALLLLYGLLYFFWLTGQFKMTDTGVLFQSRKCGHHFASGRRNAGKSGHRFQFIRTHRKPH